MIKKLEICGYDSISSVAGFFRSDTTIGGGKRQKLTQQELSDITGVITSNIARFEGGTRIPTLLMLEKYANALGKHIEVRMCDKE